MEHAECGIYGVAGMGRKMKAVDWWEKLCMSLSERVQRVGRDLLVGKASRSLGCSGIEMSGLLVEGKIRWCK
jgi:hypothetical protein